MPGHRAPLPADAPRPYAARRIPPENDIAVGISGAIHHLAGMKDGNTIIATERDEGAPIVRTADIGLAGGPFQVVSGRTGKL